MAQAMSFSEKGEKMELSQLKIPTHVSIIMDGNGRWAKSKGMPRTYGHSKGADVLMDICEDADALGIKYLTVYAFSTENWSRPETEVKTLMFLFRKYIKICYGKAMKNNTRVRVIGDKTGLAEDLRESIRVLEEDTAKNTGLQFQIAINYGSRDEITRGMRRMAQDAAEGKLIPAQITEETIEGYLDTAGVPDPDLLIRTSGELRLSNFLLWQLAYTEFYFTDVAWPDFHKEDLIRAIEKYNGRDRRYGGVKEE